ncbi:MAG: YqgE/AlgH family protein [Cytophagaceae bacterium]|nr:YqgE/AlgH family protein [Cytophagaceae bacterium]
MKEYEKVNRGSILISEPYLGDDNFERSVVLICEHNEEGTVGFVLNRPANLTLDAVVPDISECAEILFVGGPVQQDSLHFIYRNNEYVSGSIKINEQMFWGGSYDEMIDKINNKLLRLSDFRFFLGYSGWSPGQLEQEMEQNSWIVAEAGQIDLFGTDPNDLWRVLLKDMGGKYKMYSNYPIDPRLN